MIFKTNACIHNRITNTHQRRNGERRRHGWTLEQYWEGYELEEDECR
jgi:hypothetical protein